MCRNTSHLRSEWSFSFSATIGLLALLLNAAAPMNQRAAYLLSFDPRLSFSAHFDPTVWAQELAAAAAAAMITSFINARQRQKDLLLQS